jgi:hypothetical protein
MDMTMYQVHDGAYPIMELDIGKSMMELNIGMLHS